MKQKIRNAGAKTLVVLKNPVLRPFEVWALRAAFGAIAVKLGLDLKSVV